MFSEEKNGTAAKIQAKTEEARAKEKIRPLLESRMMRDILLEIGQRGNEALDPQSVPLAMRRRAATCQRKRPGRPEAVRCG